MLAHVQNCSEGHFWAEVLRPNHVFDAFSKPNLKQVMVSSMKAYGNLELKVLSLGSNSN